MHSTRLNGRTPYPPFLPWTPENAEHNVTLVPERLDQPLRWRKPRMIFVNSMSDLFHELVPDDYIGEVFRVMGKAPQHTFQVLTKRPERMREILRDRSPIWAGHPLPNVWLGTSIENRRWAARADALRETPAAVRFISAEPLLGPLVEHTRRPGLHTGPPLDLTGIDWLIVGGESGPRHRRIRPEWVLDLRDAAECAGTAFFFKQWGGARPSSGGRELDGRTWDEYPEPADNRVIMSTQ